MLHGGFGRSRSMAAVTSLGKSKFSAAGAGAIFLVYIAHVDRVWKNHEQGIYQMITDIYLMESTLKHLRFWMGDFCGKIII